MNFDKYMIGGTTFPYLPEIIKDLKQYFKIQEFVSRDVYKKYGEEKCWAFFRPELLLNTLVIRRDILQVGMVCNDWVYGGTHHQRGFRENTCQLCKDKTKSGVIYGSPHPLGGAFDFVSARMSAEEMRRSIVEGAYLLPYPLRLERNVSWLHEDVCCLLSQKEKVYCFTA